MPTPIVLPTMTASPKPRPSRRRSWPRAAVPAPRGAPLWEVGISRDASPPGAPEANSRLSRPSPVSGIVSEDGPFTERRRSMLQRKSFGLAGLLVLGVLGATAPARAGAINTATIRAHVLASYADCTLCSFGVPHGCFVVLDTPDEAVNVHLPPLGGEDCAVEEDACIEATGPV